MRDSKVIADANTIIHLHHLSLWQAVIHSRHIAVTPTIRLEVKFYRDNEGQKKPIDLNKDIQERKIEQVDVSVTMLSNLRAALRASFLQGIDTGEEEAIAFLYGCKQEDSYLFCTADQIAIKCLGILGLGFRGLSIQELLENIGKKKRSSIQHAHSKELLRKLVGEGEI